MTDILVFLPEDLLNRLVSRANVEHVEPGSLLVDVLATELPEAMAEVLRGALAAEAGSFLEHVQDAEKPAIESPAPRERPSLNAATIVPGSGPSEPEPDDGHPS
jgi:hypothetical protein